MKITDRIAAEPAFAKALADARERAAWSGCDQHIIRRHEGGYWVLDDGDGLSIAGFADRIVYTLKGPRHGQY